MEGNWHLCCMEEAVGFCLGLCNCRLGSWGVIAILAAPVLLFCWWCCLFLWIRRLQSIPKIPRVWLKPMRSRVDVHLKEKKKFEGINSIITVKEWHNKGLCFPLSDTKQESKFPDSVFSFSISLCLEATTHLPSLLLLPVDKAEL